MKHHFGDFLDRTADYWTIIPNRERYAYMTDVDIPEKKNVKILTINKHHENWEQVKDYRGSRSSRLGLLQARPHSRHCFPCLR